MNYVGVDLHKEQSWFYVMDEFGTKLHSESVLNSQATLKGYFEKIQKPFQLAVEATYNWYYFVDLAEQYAANTYLANSYELKSFAKSHKKTDKIDARLIADVLRKGYLPTVTIPDQKTRAVKELLKYRISIVKDRSRVIFRLKNLLDKIGESSTGDFTTYKQLNAVKTEHLQNEYKESVKGYIEEIRYLTEKETQATKLIINTANKDSDVINLMTIPGLSYFSALLIKSEIVDINRFLSFGRLCAYAGLSPRVHQSGNKNIHGPLNVNRRKHLQWILLEVVLHFIKSDEKIKQRHDLLAEKKGFNTAKIINARYMLKIIYHVLKEKRPFYKAQENVVRSEACTALSGV